MNIVESHEGTTSILALEGPLDTASAPSLSARAFALCGEGARTLLLDLAKVPHLTSAGFRSFIAIRRRAAEGSIDLVLCGPNEVVRELFEISGMLGSFRILPDRGAALTAIAGAKSA